MCEVLRRVKCVFWSAGRGRRATGGGVRWRRYLGSAEQCFVLTSARNKHLLHAEAREFKHCSHSVTARMRSVFPIDQGKVEPRNPGRLEVYKGEWFSCSWNITNTGSVAFAKGTKLSRVCMCAKPPLSTL